ncbi:DUF6575 domain-containing protein [Acaryochloris sp. IP29b_bin.137]|uniref:DUF6575 domain-containing protein n=1 Tax=Acaryochloris sp. IP29b_bin.137 TaxID=2969217 RepID=UPI0026149371|nr:DUF6575 domain-containing protein [Acaryochloris sp. IP29b_bin.137]
MINFPRDTILGELYELEVFVEFNGARLFSCQNKIGQIFLVLWSAEEEDFDLWLYLIISEYKLKQIRYGNEDVQQAFLNPEYGFLYKVIFSFQENQFSAEPISSEQISQEWLPLPRTYLDCDEESYPNINRNISIKGPFIDIGELEIKEVYIKFNGNHLFACENQVKQIFLALWIEDKSDFDSWLYFLISAKKLDDIRHGKIDVRSAFLKPETGILYKVRFTYRENRYSVESIAPEQIKQEWLPEADTHLNCRSEIFSIGEHREYIDNALKMIRETATLKFSIPSDHPNEASISKLGKTLVSMQDFLDCLAKPSKKKPSPQDISKAKKGVEFNIFNTAAGSFQVELASVNFDPDFHGNSSPGNVMEHVINLMRIGSSSSKLEAYISKLPKTTAKRYLKFLEALVDTGGEFSINWGSPTPNRGGQQKLSIKETHEIIRRVKSIDKKKPEEIEIIGVLYKHDNKLWKFGIEDSVSGIKYKGDIVEQARNNAKQLTTDLVYKAKLRKIREVNVGKEERIIYQLVDIEPCFEDE